MKFPLLFLLSALFGLSTCCLRLSAASESLTIDNPETAGMSMFRAHWNQPIPLAEGGARNSWNYKDFFSSGRGQYAVWSRDARGGKPGPIAFDALNRSLLLRFPDSAEKIAAELAKGGRKISKAEIILPFADEELFPPAPQPDRPGPDSYDFKGTFGSFEAWLASRPTWHAIGYALRKPWTADEEIGPTFNAAINGALFWKKYGAQDPDQDRFPKEFGPTEVSYRSPEGCMDVTEALTSPKFGSTLATRLRNFADNGFLIKKWETYDHRFFNGVYEAPTATGSRAILLNAPRLVVTFEPGVSESVAQLAQPANVKAMAETISKQGSGGSPTAVMPSVEKIREWASVDRLRPKWADDTQWKRILELFSIREGNSTDEPFWVNFIQPHLLEPLRGTRFEGGQKVSANPASPEASFEVWVDKLIGRPVRGWSGFEVGREWSEWMLGQDILPEPAKDAIKRYWTSWLMPDRENAPDARRRDITFMDGPLVHPMIEHPGVTKGAEVPNPAKGTFDTYWKTTGDWRGNKSFYRSGFNYDISTQNFNTSASVGSFVFSRLIDSDLARKDGINGVNRWLVRGWVWSDGSGQEHYDHYYYAITLAGLKTLQNAASDHDSRLLADGLVTKGVEEAIAAWHPHLKRFLAPASRTSLEFLLGTQDGGNFIMHTMSEKGVLTDLDRKTLPGGIPVIGHELPPTLVAQMTLPVPWAEGPAANMVDNKPLPWEAVHWGVGTWRKAFLGQNYGLAAQLSGQPRIQAMAQWRRESKEVTSAMDLGTLDIRGGLNETRWANEAGGWIKQNFKQLVVQDRNRWLAMMNPVGVAGTDGVKSVQYSLGLFDIRESGPTWEIYVDSKKVEALPFELKQGQKIVIRDGVTFLGIIPIPASDLGRDAEVVIEQGHPQAYDQYKSLVGPSVVINSYLYKKDESLPKSVDPAAVRSAIAGYAVQIADSEETTFEKFLSEIAASEATATFNSSDRLVTASWQIAGDAIEMCYEAVPAEGANFDALAKFDPKLVSATKNGKPIYPDKNILRDTPVTQMAWDRAEKGGAIAESSLGRGHRIFLQSFPENGVFSYWNPQGVPTDLRYALPGGASIFTDGLIGLCRIWVDTKSKVVRIDHVRPEGLDASKDWGAATAFLLEGFDSSYRFEINGKPLEAPLSTLPLDGREVRVVPIDEMIPVRSGAEILQQLSTFAAAKKANRESSQKVLFRDFDFAGPFPGAPGVYGPERDPAQKVTDSTAYPDGQNGETVRWKNFGRLSQQPQETMVSKPNDGYTIFNAHNASSKEPCTYYLSATIRAERTQDVAMEVIISTFPDVAPRAVHLWVNGKEVEITQGRSGLARITLNAGENQVLLKVVQDSPREQRCADSVTARLGDPVLRAPLLTGVEWKGARGDWVPANPVAAPAVP